MCECERVRELSVLLAAEVAECDEQVGVVVRLGVELAAARAEVVRLQAEMQAMRLFIQDTAIDNGITVADSGHPFWRLSDGTYLPRSVVDLVWGEEARRA